MRFEVDRAKWFQGHGTAISALLLTKAAVDEPEDEGKMCCLGFRALECGHSEDEIRGVQMPHMLRSAVEHSEDWGAFIQKYPTIKHPDQKNTALHGEGTPLALAIALVNDNQELSHDSKEAILRQLFRVAGDEIVFVGGYPYVDADE